MDSEFWNIVQNIIPPTYAKQASDAIRARENTIRTFFQHKKLPEEGWDDNLIEMVLNRLSLMDSNNFPGNCSLGEREARFASALVSKRHYNFGHGVGRSGDLTEPQPKAAGSSLIYNLTNCLVQDIFKIMGMETPVKCLLVPVATGMSLVLSMLSLRAIKPSAKYVIWSRIDQKSCFKSITTAGFTPIIIDMLPNGDQLETNLAEIEKKMKDLKKEEILCVMTTTSCFAPRACDNIEAVAKLCRTYEIPHLINNAYGLQSRYIMQRIQNAQNVGRVDLFVQSTDKNFMVPVGGAIIATCDSFTMEKVAKLYPGRASSSPILDVFITLLSLGQEGYLKLIEERENSHNLMLEELKKFADLHEERVLANDDNPISIALSLTKVTREHLTRLGSMLFIRNISGTRVVSLDGFKTIAQYHFKNWGSHTSTFETPYLTVAASIGVRDSDIELFVKKLEKAMNKNARLCETITEELSMDKSSLEKGLSPSLQTLSNTSIIESCDLEQYIYGMAHGFGNLYKLRGIVQYRVSPMHLKAFHGAISHGFPNTIRRCVSSAPYILPSVVSLFAIYYGAEHIHEQLMRKDPKDYENDE